jgi:hypothetical protein
MTTPPADTERRRQEIAEALAKARDLEMLVEVVRLGESFLSAQMQSAVASDTRAMTFATVLAAIVAGAVGALATLIASNIKLGLHVISLVMFCLFMIFALRAAVHAARPTRFSFPGNNPANWTEDVGPNEDIRRSLAEQASLYAIGIERNSKVLDESHRCINVALGWVVAALGAALASEFVVTLWEIGNRGFTAVLG